MIYTIIDVETTGLDHEKDQIIEIAALKTDLKRDFGSFHTYIKLDPFRFTEVPKIVREINGITANETETGIEESEAMRLLERFVNQDTEIVVAQNAAFDLGFIYYAGEGTSFPRFLCTRALSLLNEPEESASLNKVYKRFFGEDVKDHHSAMGDVLSTKRILAEHCKRFEGKLESFVNVLIDTEDRPLQFIPSKAKVLEMMDNNIFREVSPVSSINVSGERMTIKIVRDFKARSVESTVHLNSRGLQASGEITITGKGDT